MLDALHADSLRDAVLLLRRQAAAGLGLEFEGVALLRLWLARGVGAEGKIERQNQTYFGNSELESQIFDRLWRGVRDARGDDELCVVGPGDGEDGLDCAVGDYEVLGLFGQGGAESPLVVVGDWYRSGSCGSCTA